MEKQPVFSKIIGGNEVQKNTFVESVDSLSVDQLIESIKNAIVEVNESEKSLILSAVKYSNELANLYGSDRKTNPDLIFLVKPDYVYEITEGRISQAIYLTKLQSIIVEKNIYFPKTLLHIAHECFHHTSYQAAQIFEDGTDGPYRSGIEMFDRKNKTKYFSVAQEAIISTLSKKFFDDNIAINPDFKEGIEKTEQIKNWLVAYAEKEENIKTIKEILFVSDCDILYDKIFNCDEDDTIKFKFFLDLYNKHNSIIRERRDEREKFDNVLNEIITESKGLITDKNNLFDEFAKAHFTGNYIPLARIIENSLGKGSFRKIAEKLSDTKNDGSVFDM